MVKDNQANFRNIVRSRDKWTCQKCGRSEYVQAHHIDQVKDYPLFQNLPDNGITLCVYCHADVHPEIPRNLFIANVVKAEKEGCISAGKLAQELKVNPRTIVRRAVKLGILKPMQKWMFTKEEAEVLRNAKYQRYNRKAADLTDDDMIRNQIYLSERQVGLLKCESKKYEIKISELIRRILDAHFEKEQDNGEAHNNQFK